MAHNATRPVFSYTQMHHQKALLLRLLAIATVSLTLATVASLLSCAAQTGDNSENRRLTSQALSTAIAAREALTPAARAYEEAKTRSDDAESALATANAESQRLFTVFEQGNVRCGVHPDKIGLSIRDAEGTWSGFFVDMCRAVAAAVFNHPSRVVFIEIATGDEGNVLTDGDIDILATGIDWTLQREAEWGNATLPIYFDGQSIMVKRNSEIDTFAALAGETVCTVGDTNAESALLEWADTARIDLGTMRFPNLTDAISAYELGFCSALTDRLPELSAMRDSMESPDDHWLLRGYFDEHEAVLAVPNGSDDWFDVVKFVVTGLVRAEMLGVTSENVGDAATSQTIAIRQLGGFEGDFGQRTLNLGTRVFQSVISRVGNYGEIYDRHFGQDALDIDRGRNRLVTNGGSIWVPPIR